MLNAPAGLGDALKPLPEGVSLFDSLSAAGSARFDIVLWFGTTRSGLREAIRNGRAAMTADGGLWIGWPKRSSGVATQVDEHMVRELALPTGLVDNKVCAIDETWSGLRLVIRRELR